MGSNDDHVDRAKEVMKGCVDMTVGKFNFVVCYCVVPLIVGYCCCSVQVENYCLDYRCMEFVELAQ